MSVYYGMKRLSVLNNGCGIDGAQGNSGLAKSTIQNDKVVRAEIFICLDPTISVKGWSNTEGKIFNYIILHETGHVVWQSTKPHDF